VRAGGVMVLGLSVLMFIIGMYPQPLMELVQFAGFGMMR